MRENRPSGSEGGGTLFSLPLYLPLQTEPRGYASRRWRNSLNRKIVTLLGKA